MITADQQRDGDERGDDVEEGGDAAGQHGSIATMWDNILIGGNSIPEELQIAQDAMQEILDKGAQIQIS